VGTSLRTQSAALAVMGLWLLIAGALLVRTPPPVVV
jgi:hypothetical protein